MRLVPIVLAAVLVAGCGSQVETNVPASGPDVPDSTAPVESGPNTRPPSILLVSSAGEQKAVLGSSCVDYVDPDTGSGVGACGDSTWPHPERVSVVRPRETVSIVFEDARVSKQGSVAVLALGCERDALETVRLTPGAATTEWVVDLEPGAYELNVFARFLGDDGRRSGDVSGGLGLVVSDDAKLAVEPGPPRRSNC
jgi:hypothetical protein